MKLWLLIAMALWSKNHSEERFWVDKYNTIDVGNYNRYVDTEAKTLEQVAKDLGACKNADGTINWGNTNASGTIELFTELPPFPSCDDVILQFLQKYSNLKIEVIHNNGIKLIQ